MTEYRVTINEEIYREGQDKFMTVYEYFKDKDPTATPVEILARTFTAMATLGAVHFQEIEPEPPELMEF